MQGRPLDHTELPSLTTKGKVILIALGLFGAAFVGAVTARWLGDVYILDKQAFFIGVAFGSALPVIGVSIEQRVNHPAGQEPPDSIQSLI